MDELYLSDWKHADCYTASVCIKTQSFIQLNMNIASNVILSKFTCKKLNVSETIYQRQIPTIILTQLLFIYFCSITCTRERRFRPVFSGNSQGLF